MSMLTWLGDGDPEAQEITLYGFHFVKGQPVEVSDEAVAEKLSRNPLFSSDTKETPTPAEQPSDDEVASRAEEGMDRGDLRARLKEIGVSVGPNASIETMRSKLASATKDQD